MTQDISGFGLRVTVKASVTFPSGFVLSQFADDSDPVDSQSVQVRDKAIGLNGDMVVWSKANPVLLTLAVIPGTEDDRNLSILAAANRAAPGRRPNQDIITATVAYPDGTTVRLLRGVITDAILGKPVASAGRMKTKPYIFAFEDVQ